MMSRRLIACAALAALAGCQCKPEIVEVRVPVEVPGPTQYVPVPDELLADCEARPAPIAAGVTGGALLAAAKAWESWAQCMDARRAEVGGLAKRPQPGPSK